MLENTSQDILHRNTAGLDVSVNYLPITATLVLRVECNGETAAVTIEPERVRDAFEHPAVYLNDAQVAKLFARVADES